MTLCVLPTALFGRGSSVTPEVRCLVTQDPRVSVGILVGIAISDIRYAVQYLRIVVEIILGVGPLVHHTSVFLHICTRLDCGRLSSKVRDLKGRVGHNLLYHSKAVDRFSFISDSPSPGTTIALVQLTSRG